VLQIAYAADFRTIPVAIVIKSGNVHSSGELFTPDQLLTLSFQRFNLKTLKGKKP
jgi:hypothetical protein